MALKTLIATDRDKLAAAEQRVADLRDVLRDVYDVAKNGKPLSAGLLARVRINAAFGREKVT